MKKQIFKFLLGIVYIGVVVVLLFVHIQSIAGQQQRMMAMVETILLGIPAILFLYLYMRLQQSLSDKQPNEKAEICENNTTAQSAITCYEDLGEVVKGFGLSEREAEVAWLLYRGYTNRQIAEELFIAESTVKKHASHIYEKMQVSGRKEFKERIKVELSENSGNNVEYSEK